MSALCMHKWPCCHTHTHAHTHTHPCTCVHIIFISCITARGNTKFKWLQDNWNISEYHSPHLFLFVPYFGRCFYHLFCFPLNRCYHYIVIYITLKFVEYLTIIWSVFCGLCIRRMNISHECLNRSMYCDGVKWTVSM